MPVVEVRDASGAIVWQSVEVDVPIVEVVERVVRVTDFDTGQVLGTHSLKSGEEIVPRSSEKQ
jgi:hypothetical protein